MSAPYRVWHLMQAQLRGLQWFLYVWSAGCVLLFVAGLHATEYLLLSVAVSVLRAIGTIAAVDGVMRQHPSGAVDAFWRTRPISRTVMFVSMTLVTLCVGVAVPTLASGFATAAVRLPGRAIRETMLAVSLEHTVVWVVAVVAVTFTRSIANTLALVMVGALSTVLMAWISGSYASGRTDPWFPLDVLVACVFVIGVALIYWRTHRPRDARAPLVVGLAGVTVVMAAMVGVFGAPWRSPDVAMSAIVPIRVAVSRANDQSRATPSGLHGDVDAVVRLTAASPSIHLRPRAGHAVFTAGDRSMPTRLELSDWATLASKTAARNDIASAGHCSSLASTPTSAVETFRVTLHRRASAQQHDLDAPHGRLDVLVETDAYESVAVARLPFEAGQVATTPQGTLALVPSRSVPGLLPVAVRWRGISSYPFAAETTYLLRDRISHACHTLELRRSGDEPLTFIRHRLTTALVYFWAYPGTPAHTLSNSNDAELVVIESRWVGRYAAHAVMEDFAPVGER